MISRPILLGFALWIILALYALLCRALGADGAFIPGVALVGIAGVLYSIVLTIYK